MHKFLFITMLFFAVMGCSESSNDEMEPNDNNINNNSGEGDNEALVAAENYFDNTLQSVIKTNCITCHSGHHSGNNLSNYSSFDNARNRASQMYNLVNSGSMPQGTGKLPQAEIDKFKEFMDLVNAIN